MPDDTAALLNLAERLIAIAEGRKRPQKDPRPNINFRLQPEELIALDNAAAARGLCRSDLIRDALQPILGISMRSRQGIPDNFRRRHNRTKPAAENFKPTDADIREHARLAMAHNLALRTARIDSGTMTETAARGVKLRRRG